MNDIKRHVRLPRSLVNDILHQAQIVPEKEVCGLIGSRDEKPVRIYPVRNAAAAPKRRFDMDAHEQVEAMRSMRERGEELFAIYHSHPEGNALPSVADLEDTGYPDALYLIVALGTKGVLEMRGYHVEDGTAEEIELEIF